MAEHFKTVDDYVKTFPGEIQKRLTSIRKFIKSNYPKSEEVISYNMPAFKQDNHRFLYLGAYKNHISIYPFPAGVKEFKKYEEEYVTSHKGTIQFQHSKEIPLEIVKKIADYNIKKYAKKP